MARSTILLLPLLLLLLLLPSQPASSAKKRGKKKGSNVAVFSLPVADEMGLEEGDIVVYQNGNMTGAPPFVLREDNDEVWDVLTSGKNHLRDALGNRIRSRDEAVAARVVFGVGAANNMNAVQDPRPERWIHPALEDGYTRQIPLPITKYYGAAGNKSKQSALFELETLSDRPRVLQVRDFLSEHEAMHLRRLASPGLKGSVIATGGKHEDRAMRNHKSGWLPPRFGNWLGSPTDALVEGIVERGAALMRTNAKLCEGLQVVSYMPGQHYWAHTDYLETAADRWSTVLLYLSDEESDGLSGGETVFPLAGMAQQEMREEVREYISVSHLPEGSAEDDRGKLREADRGLAVTPRMGTALIFYNMRPPITGKESRSMPDETTFHLASDVTAGEKWAANMWFYNREPLPGEPNYFDV